MVSIEVVTNDARLLDRWKNLSTKVCYRVIPATPGSAVVKPNEKPSICLLDLDSDRTLAVHELCALVQESTDRAIIALTAIPRAAEGLAVLRAGCKGYCNRQISAPALRAVIATVLGGEIWAGRQVTEYLLEKAIFSDGDEASVNAPLDVLTSRERQVAEHVAEGHSNKSIAAALHISERTVKAHLNAVFRKTGVTNRVQLAIVAQEQAASNVLRYRSV